MSKIKNPLSPARWAYLKSLPASTPRLFHSGSKPYDVGNNKRKREAKAARKLRG